MVQRVASESFPVELIQFFIALALFISTPVWMRCCSAAGLSPLALNLPVESHCEIKIYAQEHYTGTSARARTSRPLDPTIGPPHTNLVVASKV